MTGRLDGKVTLITGGSRGIGWGIAQCFAKEGAKVFLNARDPQRLEESSKELRSATGAEVAWLDADVSDREQVDALVQKTLDSFGRIDVLVNNAGIYKPARFVDYSFQDFSQVVSTNLYSVFHMTQAVLPGMMERQKGKIINISSTAGKWGSRNQSAYNASKHAIVGLTRCLGLELAPYNINVNAICPWIVETDLVETFVKEHAAINNVPEDAFRQAITNTPPIKRLIHIEEIGHLAVYLASDESDFINCQAWMVDGGYTMV